MKLTRFLFYHAACGRKAARIVLAEGRVSVEGEVEKEGSREIGDFTKVTLDGVLLRDVQAVYLMLHKPAGYLSATIDPEHPTVMELIDKSEVSEELHIAGRLDRASTGLLLLTNDGKWSRQVTEPKQGVPKVYLVETEHAISDDTHRQFSSGIYFAYEDIVTQPAELEIISECCARLTIYEGKYHQIKRMFHAVGNRVTSLHRESVGHISLGDLAEGEYRPLTTQEISHE